MKYIMKYMLVGLTAAWMTACSDRFATDEEEQTSEAQNGSRTELVEKTVTLTETEGLESLIGSERTELQKLTVNGRMDYYDIEFMNKSLPLLTVLDLKNASFDSNTIPSNFVSENTMLEEVVLPQNLKTIGYNAFQDCKSLRKVTMSEGITEIFDHAFSGCEKLKEVVLPNSLQNLGYRSFYNVGLDTLRLSNNIANIYDEAFAESDLVYVDFNCNNTDYMGSGIFRLCDRLNKVILHEGITRIPDNFLEECTNLKSIDIPNSVTEIGGSAFHASGITEVDINNGVTSIRYGAYMNCMSLKKVTISNLISWDSNVFRECEELEEVTLNNNITQIPYGTFWGCTKLKNITLPDNIEIIGGDSFYKSGLTSIDLKNVQSLGGGVFSGTAIKTFTLPASVTEVGNNPVENCDSLEYVVWKSSADIPILFGGENTGALVFVETQNGIVPAVNETVKGKVIVDNQADSLFIDISNWENYVFNCPRTVNFRKIVFRKDFHCFSYIEPGEAANWRTIVLPVVPTKIVTADDGRVLAPFNTEMETDYCPFWLRRLTENGFRDTTAIEANKPYIINMPYNPNLYYPEYNINTYVDFIAENGTLEPVPEQFTPDTGMGMTFWPNYRKLDADGFIYALNEDYWVDENRSGSVFARGLFEVKPFQGYITTTSGNTGTSELRMDDIFGKAPASRTAKPRNNTGKPQIDDL